MQLRNALGIYYTLSKSIEQYSHTRGNQEPTRYLCKIISYTLLWRPRRKGLDIESIRMEDRCFEIPDRLTTTNYLCWPHHHRSFIARNSYLRTSRRPRNCYDANPTKSTRNFLKASTTRAFSAVFPPNDSEMKIIDSSALRHCCTAGLHSRDFHFCELVSEIFMCGSSYDNCAPRRIRVHRKSA